MPNWKKVVVSGSSALLNSVTVTNGIVVTGSLSVTANITGSNARLTALASSANTRIVVSDTSGNLFYNTSLSLQGTQGASVQGSQGIIGTSIQGAQGIIGTSIQGAQGIIGTSVQGSQGIIGTSIQGAQGIIGTSIQGSQGIIGTSIQGSQGIIGTSIQGSAGAQGRQGTVGSQGTQGTSALTSITNNTDNYLVTATGTGTPFNGEQNFQFDGSRVALTGSLNVSGSTNLRGSGSAVFSIDGTLGRLFQVDDSFSGSLFSVNTAAGLPIIEAFSDNTVKIGKFNQEAIVISGSGGNLQLSGSIVLPSLATAADTNVVVFNTSTKKISYNTALSLQGTSGAQGVQGIIGTSIQGATGTSIQGATGTSIQGSTGTSVQGAQGIIGTSIQGAQGIIGTSVQGAQGIIGTSIQGAQGIIGTSIQGAQGIIGTAVQGAQGIIGTSIQGAAGAQGTTGTSIQGTVGTAGSNGSQGATGTSIQGAAGAQGRQGTVGSNGSQGTVGTAGSNGSQGTVGTAGSNGSQGATGTAGSNGSQGATGTAGSNGSQGTVGAQGIQGVLGQQGDNAGLRYNFSTVLTDSDPGTGTFRFNNAVESNVFEIYIDLLDQGSVDFSAFIDTWDDSTSPVNKGYIEINSNSNSDTTHIIFVLYGVTTAVGYRKLSVAYLSGTAPANAEACTIRFYRAGDRGSQGTVGTAGSNGSQGTVGTAGSNGSQGSTGTAGSNGSQGTVGTGSQGSTGGGGAVTSFTNGADNRVLTAVTATTINGEANLTYDGTDLVNTIADGYIKAQKDADEYVWLRSLGVIYMKRGTTELTIDASSGGINLTPTITSNVNLNLNATTVAVQGALTVSSDITATGNVIAYSDQSVKDNVTTIPNALDKVQAMRGVTFTRNDQEDTERVHAGVIAQEIEKAFPEVVFENPDGTKGVAYGNIVSVLIEAIKEQQKQIDDLKQQIKELL